MSARAAVFLAAAAIALNAPAAAADRGTPGRVPAAQSASQSAPAELASASATDQQIKPPPAAVPAKRRPTPRVTSCRCGGETELASTDAAPQR